MKWLLIDYSEEKYVSLILEILTRIPQLLLPLPHQILLQMPSHLTITLKAAHVEDVVVQKEHYAEVVDV